MESLLFKLLKVKIGIGVDSDDGFESEFEVE